MSAAGSGLQLAAPTDRALLPVGSGLYRGSFRSSIHSRVTLHTSLIHAQPTAFVIGRYRTFGKGSAAEPLQLRVLARDAPQGLNITTSTRSSVTSPDIIVLGLTHDTLVPATPVADGAPKSLAGELPIDATLIPTLEPRLESLIDSTVAASPSQAAFVAAASALQPAAQSILPSTTQQITSQPKASVSSIQQSTGSELVVSLSDVPSSHVGTAPVAVAEEATTTAATTGSVYVVAQATAAASTVSASSIPASPSAPESDVLATSAAVPLPSAQPRFQKGHWLQALSSRLRSIQWGKLWALALLSISYVHQATTGFALPAMLPMISNELHLTDLQGALLTTGYSYLYAVALVPIGLLADRVSRPKLLAAGLALWSLLTCTASTCRSFGDLILARVGFAAAQGAQNPVCFSLIPELFPVNKSTALSLYNCAIYVGRALSFAAVLLARHLHDNDQAHLAARGGLRIDTRLDHLDRADLHSLSIMHTTGEMAAATPDREFNFPPWEYGSELPDSAWRQVLRWIAIPGFLIGLAMMTTLQEPRQQTPAAAASTAPQPIAVVAAPAKAAPAAVQTAAGAVAAPPLAAAPPLTAAKADAEAPKGGSDPVVDAQEGAVATKQDAAAKAASGGGSRGGVGALLRSPGFMSVTLAAALNDVGSYALIAWQSTFYERVYGLESSAYAPVLAALLPIGGILGGVGGGYLADRLSRSGRRWLVTAGATCVAAPCLAASCLAPSPEASYAALVVGFALSEMWRAPSAVMARGLAPASMGSTASALYLCIRNLLGGLGPLAVAGLIGVCGLQRAMMVVPAMYLASGVLFAKAEKLYDREMSAKTQAAAA